MMRKRLLIAVAAGALLAGCSPRFGSDDPGLQDTPVKLSGFNERRHPDPDEQHLPRDIPASALKEADIGNLY